MIAEEGEKGRKQKTGRVSERDKLKRERGGEYRSGADDRGEDDG